MVIISRSVLSLCSISMLRFGLVLNCLPGETVKVLLTILLWRYQTACLYISSQLSINFYSLIFVLLSICSYGSWQASLMWLHGIQIWNFVQETTIIQLVWYNLLLLCKRRCLLANFEWLMIIVLNCADVKRTVDGHYVSFVMRISLLLIWVLRRSLINSMIHRWHKSFGRNSSLVSCGHISRWRSASLSTLIESRPNVLIKVLVHWVAPFWRTSLVRTVQSYSIRIHLKEIV